MSLKYCVIEIFSSEKARYQNKPLHEAVVDYVRSLKIAARCMVIRGTEACYENGEIATQNILEISFNMPVKIEILLPAAERDRLLPTLQEMVSEGVVGLRELDIYLYKTRKSLLPRQIRVRDVMSVSPQKAITSTSVKDVMQLLLSAGFNGVPVVDANDRVIGIVTKKDLFRRANMPLKLGFLAELSWDNMDPALKSLAERKAEDIMTPSPVTIEVDELLSNAVKVMLKKGVKRLPVVDKSGELVGMLSRLDVFRTITTESPDWQAIQKHQVIVEDLHVVADIMRTDAHTVLPDTPVDTVIHIIDADDIQRVAVTDEEGQFLGLISDRDLLGAFSDKPASIWGRLADKLLFSEKGQKEKIFGDDLREKTAAEVMQTDLITVQEQTRIDEAIKIMAEKGLKRLPVVAADGKYKGIVSRNSLLRAGFED